MKYFFTFGAGEKNFIEAGIRLVRQAKETNVFDKALLFTDIDLRKDSLFWNKHGAFVKSNPKGYGYWIWKPYLILKMLEKMYEGDVLIYADSGCEIHIQNKSLLEDVIRKTKIDSIVGSTIATERNWTKKDLLLHMNMMTIGPMFSPQHQGTALAFLKNEKTMSLVKEWYEIASQYHLLDDSPGVNKNFHFFMQHRHDQSIFSLLTKKHNLYSKFSIDKAIGLLRNKTGISQFSTNNNVSLNSEKGMKLFGELIDDSCSFFTPVNKNSSTKEEDRFSGKKNDVSDIEINICDEYWEQRIPYAPFNIETQKSKSDPEITLFEMENAPSLTQKNRVNAESFQTINGANNTTPGFENKNKFDPENVIHNTAEKVSFSEKTVRMPIEIIGSETDSDSDSDDDVGANDIDLAPIPIGCKTAQTVSPSLLKPQHVTAIGSVNEKRGNADATDQFLKKKPTVNSTPFNLQMHKEVSSQNASKNTSINDYKIVVARYNEDINWLTPVMKNCIVYNKGTPLHLENEIMLKNVGRESDTYLQFIIRNYERLPDVVVFTQGNIKDHISKDNIKFLLEVKDHAQQCGISKPMEHYIQGEYSPWNPEFNKIETKYLLPDCYKDNHRKTFKEWFIQNFQREYPNPLLFYAKGLFAVHKDKIRKHSLDYYKNLVLQVNHHVNSVEGHFFERSWFYVFL
jgi:hypothetical protein